MLSNDLRMVEVEGIEVQKYEFCAQLAFCSTKITINRCIPLIIEALPGGGPRSLVGILKRFVSAFCQGSRRCRKLRDNYFSSLSLILGFDVAVDIF